MDIALIKTALGLEADSTDVAVLERIQEIRAAAGDSEYSKEDPTITLIRAGQHEQCCLNADGTITMTLLEPIKSGKDTIGELTFRRPRMRDMRVASEGKAGMATTIALAAALSSTTAKIVEDLDWQDSLVLTSVVNFFLQPSRQTGGKS